MVEAVRILALVLVAVAMALSLAHALEFPGKQRLGKETYIAVQAIYYPGFTIGGFSEPLGILAVLALLFITPAGTAGFWFTLVALAALMLMHATYWVMTHPVNNSGLRAKISPDSAPDFSRSVRAPQ